jgi:hypothetical protein
MSTESFKKSRSFSLISHNSQVCASLGSGGTRSLKISDKVHQELISDGSRFRGVLSGYLEATQSRGFALQSWPRCLVNYIRCF